MKKLGDWLDVRTGHRRLLGTVLDEPVPGGPSFAYVFGSVLVFILLLQAATGILLALYYSPSSSTAWASVAYIQDEVTLGWLIRGLHSHGASAMVIVAGLHLLQTATYGAYKKPREITWLVGVLLLSLILAFALTGYLLPWDQKGYWATKVATGIVGSVPLVGRWLQAVLQGGNEYGNLTLTRFYALHVLVLPGIVLALVVVHIALFRRHGATPRWGRSDRELVATRVRFWPDQMVRDMAAIAVTFAALFYFATRERGVSLAAPADPASSYDARPEWYFVPLFELLKHFHGAAEEAVALGAPLLVFLFLFALPFLDRGPDRAPARRIPYLGMLGAGVIGTVALLVMSLRADAKDAQFAARVDKDNIEARRARVLAREGVPPPGGTAVWRNEPAARQWDAFSARAASTEDLWEERCAGCHVGDERRGPELAAGYNNRAWIRAFLQNPDGARYFGPTEKIHKMKPVKFTGRDLTALVELIYAQTGAQDAFLPVAARGADLFEENPPDGGSACADCHTIAERVDDQGPNLWKRGSREWLEAFIVEPEAEHFFGDLNEMPPEAGRELTPEELSRLVDYLIFLRGLPPGGAP